MECYLLIFQSFFNQFIYHEFSIVCLQIMKRSYEASSPVYPGLYVLYSTYYACILYSFFISCDATKVLLVTVS